MFIFDGIKNLQPVVSVLAGVSDAMIVRRTLIFTSLFCYLLSYSPANAEFNARAVTAVQASHILKENPDIKILDVRTGIEYRRGHLQGAVNLNYYSFSFKSKLANLDKDATWLVHCHSGVRSSKTIPLMKAAGFGHVIDVSDGMVGWKNAGLPVVK